MLIRAALFAAAALAVQATETRAVDPVISAYRDYQVAEARHDLTAAEGAAKAALAAAEADGAHGDQLAALAFNLTLAEIDLGHDAEAIAPARRALSLADAGARGVDPLAVRLMLGEAEVAVTPTASQSDLLTALQEASNRRDLDNYAYPAAVALGESAMRLKDYSEALTAYAAAERHAAGAGEDTDLARGRAFIGEGLALMNQYSDRQAYKALTSAIDLLAPLAPEAADDSETPGEFSFAKATALRSAERTRYSTRHPAPPWAKDKTGRKGLKGLPSLCPGDVKADPSPAFRRDLANSQFSTGAAVMRAKRDDKGEITAVTPLVIVPDDMFRSALVDHGVHWTFTRSPSAPAGCRLQTTDLLFTVNFTLLDLR